MTTDTLPGGTKSMSEDPAANTPRTWRRVEVTAWALLGVMTLWAVVQVLSFDYREHPVRGDQASFLLQALSLAGDGHNLSYDANDLDEWRTVGWSHDPHGLFYQENSDGYAFAKPYGVSALHAASIFVAGPRWGVALTHVGLLLGTVGISIALLRLRLRGPAVPLVTMAFVFGSAVWWYSFVIMTELFLVCLVGVALYALLRGHDRQDWRWAALGFAVTAFTYTEKAPMLLVLGPACLVALIGIRSWLRRGALVAVAITTLVLATLPYLYYSDFESTSPYGGDRYYGAGHLPFDAIPAAENQVQKWDSAELHSLGYVTEHFFEDVPAKLSSLYYTVTGRRTGLLPFMPLALLVVGGVCVVAVRRRSIAPMTAALLFGAAAYLGFYAWVFPFNYYGGGGSAGNRYWVQASIVIVALAATSSLRARTLSVMAGIALATSLALTPHHHLSPDDAYFLYRDTSALQDLLPLEKGTLSEVTADEDP